MEGRHAALTRAGAAAQGCIVIEFIYPCAFWAVAAFRTADPHRVQNFKRMPDDDPATLDDEGLQARLAALEAEVAALRGERAEALR
jgi:hypothetical protein